MHLHLISKSDARDRGLKHYFTGTPCKRGGIGERRSKDGSCVCYQCVLASRERASKWQSDYPDLANARKKDWARNNPDSVKRSVAKNKEKYPQAKRQSQAKYYRKNRAEIYAKQIDWSARNRGKRSEYSRQYSSKNPGKIRQMKAKRKAAKIQRTPSWLTVEHRLQISAIYIEAAARRRAGEDVHVDHIVPLRGINVSGLHVPWNLAIIPASVNQRKSNKFSS